MDPRHNRIDYVELGARNAGDYATTKAFFETAFGWTYQEYGPDYCDTKSSGVGRCWCAQWIAVLIAPVAVE